MKPGPAPRLVPDTLLAAACLILSLASAAPFARAQSAPALAGTWLAGTWIAIDDGFPRLVASGLLVPTEEILEVSNDGHAESRLMLTTGLDLHYMCMSGWGCSDFLPVRAAQAQMNGNTVIFADRTSTPAAAKITRTQQLLAASLTLIATAPQWTVSVDGDGRRARFDNGQTTRHFAKIDAARLNKLRGALSPLEISYAVHWRCFLSQATARDPAFDRLGGPRRAQGAWLEDYLDAAIELHRLMLLTSAPYSGDELSKSDPDWARSATMQVTNSLLGPNVAYPKTLAERLKYRAPLLAITATTRLHDEKLGMEAARKLDPAFSGLHTVSRRGLTALGKALNKNAAQDKDVRETFCLDLQNIPSPRSDYDPFRGRVAN